MTFAEDTKMKSHRIIWVTVTIVFTSLIIGGAFVLWKNIVPIDHTKRLPTSEHWLNQESCSMPCWNNIKPGMPAFEALEILQKTENVTNLQVHHDKILGRGEIDWEWSNVSANGRVYYDGSSVQKGNVYAILPGFTCCIRLEQVITTFGPPEYAYTIEIQPFNPTSSQLHYTYTLVWIKKGFSAKGYPLAGTKIDGDFQIDYIAFFKPSIDGFIELEGNASKGITPWHGYDDARNYLKSLE